MKKTQYAQRGADVTSPAVGQTVLLPVGSGTWSAHVVGDAKEYLI